MIQKGPPKFYLFPRYNRLCLLNGHSWKLITTSYIRKLFRCECFKEFWYEPRQERLPSGVPSGAKSVGIVDIQEEKVTAIDKKEPVIELRKEKALKKIEEKPTDTLIIIQGLPHSASSNISAASWGYYCHAVRSYYGRLIGNQELYSRYHDKISNSDVWIGRNIDP